MPLHPVTLTLALFVLVLGWFYGRLTKRFGMFRTSLAVILGLYAYMIFWSNGYSGLRLFLLGVLLNHVPLLVRIALWARSLGDWWFALRHRRSFEDIRAQEEMDTDASAAKRRAYHQTGQDNAQQSAWRAQANAARRTKKQSADNAAKPKVNDKEAKARRTSRSSSNPSSSSKTRRSQTSRTNTRSSQGARPKSTSTLRPSQHDSAFQTLGLDPQRRYSPYDLKLAFRSAAKRAHPDLGGSTQQFMAVQAAYKFLLNGGST